MGILVTRRVFYRSPRIMDNSNSICCHLFLFVLFISNQVNNVHSVGNVIFGVNCGGDAHIDTDGIFYDKDPLEGKTGIGSDFGRQYLTIGRVADSDAILYQTERYHHANFGYDIPIAEDGDYVLVLKFCEVCFTAPSMKVFDVTLNGVHTIVSYLDIFEKVGKVLVNDEESELAGKKIKVEFIKGNEDNPKANAIYVVKGLLEDVAKLPPLAGEMEEEEREEKPTVVDKSDSSPSPASTPMKKKRETANPKIPNPYGDE